MSYTDWIIKTRQIGTCSCNYGCPCEFNAPPTRTPCEGVMALEIVDGHFGDVSLDGLKLAGAYSWPGAVHEGGGAWWSVFDKNATEDQLEALYKILGGEEQEPTTGFAIYASTIEHEPDPVFADIEFEYDLDNATGSFSVNGVLEATVEPIRNPVTGGPHRVAIKIPEGFEFLEGEMASSSFSSRGTIEQEHKGCYGFLSFVSYGPYGIIKEQSHPNEAR